MKTDLHPCFVLHTRPYRESSLLVDILSSEFGRLRIVAKGVKRAKNNRSLLLQTGRKLLISWSRRGSLGTLTAVEDMGIRFELDRSKIISCFYLNELLIRLLHTDEPHPDIFDFYQQALGQLSQNCPEQQVLRIFEKKLLQALGYGLILDHDAISGETIDTQQSYYYRVDFGPGTERPDAGRSLLISGKALVALDKEDTWDDEIARETKKLLRMVLDNHVGDKPLGSRELYRAYLQTTSDV